MNETDNPQVQGWRYSHPQQQGSDDYAGRQKHQFAAHLQNRRAMVSRKGTDGMVSAMPGVETRQCLNCGEVKPISEFYHRKDGRHLKWCKACDRARAREYQRRVYSTPEGRAKLLAYRAKYRAEHREEIKEAKRLRRRAAGIMPRHRLDRQKILKMYAEGHPVEKIAEECGTKVETVRQYAAGTGIKRERADRAQVCRNCWLYPCFKGIENFETNFALTCRSWHLRGKVK